MGDIAKSNDLAVYWGVADCDFSSDSCRQSVVSGDCSTQPIGSYEEQFARFGMLTWNYKTYAHVMYGNAVIYFKK